MAIETLFGPSVADVQELRRLQAEKEIAGAGKEFGVFAPLYQAGLRFGGQAVQGINTLLGAQDPMLKKATDIQGILTQYQDQDLTDATVLKKISKDLAGKGYASTRTKPVDYALLGYKGSEYYDSGILYCPYIPVMVQRTIGPNDFSPRVGLLTRYGVVDHIFGASLYYHLVICTGLGQSFVPGSAAIYL